MVTFDFRSTLNKDNSFSIHQRIIQSLALEISKFLNGLSPSLLNTCSIQTYQTHMIFEIDKYFTEAVAQRCSVKHSSYNFGKLAGKHM